MENNLEDQKDPLQLQNRLLTWILPRKVPRVPVEEERVPYQAYHTNPISFVMFWWLNPILKTGYKRTVTDKDLYTLEKSQSSDSMYAKFKDHLKRGTDKAKAKHMARYGDLSEFKLPITVVPWALYYTLFWEYTYAIILKILADSCTATQPLLQKKLIEFVELRVLGFESSIGKGIGYSIGCCLMIFFNSVATNHYFNLTMICGAKIRAILTKALLDKSMTVDAQGNHDFPAAKVQSMMSTDLNRIDLAVPYLPFILVCWISIAICIGLLISNIGVSALVGIGVFIVVVCFLGVSIPRLFKFRKEATKFTDIRVNLIKELLNSFKMIKFYSWESSYQSRIKEARNSEMKFVFTLQAFRNVLISFAMTMPNFASMAAFCTYYTISNGHNVSDIFSSLSLFQTLSVEFMLVPMALMLTTDMILGIKRITQYIDCNDRDITKFNYQIAPPDSKYAVKIENAEFMWDTFQDIEDNKSSSNSIDQINEITPFSDSNSDFNYEKKSINNVAFSGLQNINLTVNKGEFVVITGSIGSGKSSLLQAMAGLMPRINGEVKVNGSLLMCGYPWVQNATVRQNIIFGLPFEKELYEQVIRVCNLEADLSQFTGGDLTEVGERGITLSGGQKARINLARAVYANKDIILLDDVLSAVDAKVGKFIVENCLLGYLAKKTRILATHQLGLIERADRLIFMNGDGSIDIGTVQGLLENNEAVRKLFSFLKENESIEEEEEGEDDNNINNANENYFAIQDINDVNYNQKSDAEDMDETLNQSLKHRHSTKIIEQEVKIIGDEEKAVNALGWDVYWNYSRLGFGKLKLTFPILLILSAILSTFCNIFSNNWLSYWIENKWPDRSNHFYMGLYIMFTFLYALFLGIEYYLLTYFSNSAAKLLNIEASKKIMHAPMAFMDVSPIGRVLNRFTKDTDVLDNQIVEEFRNFMAPLCSIMGTIILCIIYIPWFAIAVPIILIFYVSIADYYQATGREVKRLEAIKRSFVYSHFSETIGGRSTIRSYHKVDDFVADIDKLLDNQNESYYINIALQRWLGTNLSLISVAIVFVISMLCCFRVFEVSAADTGLLLTYVMTLSNQFSFLINSITKIENEFNSVERLDHYAFHLVQEAPYEIPENDPPSSWPQNAQISFKNVKMKYRPELPYVLKGVSLDFKPNEKIGFCGRTGAGKSTFMTCLYRLTEFEGLISIDGVNISELGLHTLRSKLSIIPQDPVLFIGNIRQNLDPFSEMKDDELWEAMALAGLIDRSDLSTVKNQSIDNEQLHKFHLLRQVEDEGSNFSLGERQLIALARALVRKTKILILDEATSSVDYETDALIQKTITEQFGSCTILCIAHRLKTIIKYDRIVVMDNGEVAEFGKPIDLYNNKGVFWSMCCQADINISDF